MNPLRTLTLPIALLALASAALVGCSPAPEPTRTQTAAFAYEEEAFAAAEETYRAYIDELIDIDTDDPKTLATLYDLTSGDFEAADRKTFSELHAAGYKLTGQTQFASFRGISADETMGEVVAAVCMDVSRSDVIDHNGESMTPPDRPELNPLLVTFLAGDDHMTIDHAGRNENASCES